MRAKSLMFQAPEPMASTYSCPRSFRRGRPGDFTILPGVPSFLSPSFSTSCVLTLVSTEQGASGITDSLGSPAERLSGI